MKMSVLYSSVTGNTRQMAEVIAQGMASVAGVQARAFSIDDVDEAHLAESRCVVLGTPTYMASMSAAVKTWLEEKGVKLGLAGKMCGAFATARYIHGGSELAIQSILAHLMVAGMLPYSGGAAFGPPVIHLGPVAIDGKLAESREVFLTYGERMAKKAMELFG